MSTKRPKASSDEDADADDQERPWTLTFTAFQSGPRPAPQPENPFRMEKPKFYEYCRVCMCGSHGDDETILNKPPHQYDPKTMMKTHLFQGPVEVDPSARAEYEAMDEDAPLESGG
jgi:hypothetical protein